MVSLRSHMKGTDTSGVGTGGTGSFLHVGWRETVRGRNLDPASVFSVSWWGQNPPVLTFPGRKLFVDLPSQVPNPHPSNKPTRHLALLQEGPLCKQGSYVSGFWLRLEKAPVIFFPSIQPEAKGRKLTKEAGSGKGHVRTADFPCDIPAQSFQPELH